MAAKRIRNSISIYILLAFSALLILFVYSKIRTNLTKPHLVSQPNSETGDKQKILVAENIVYVDIARSAGEKTKGLSGRNSLGENEGMLFVFEENSRPTFWMKDMNFGLDIIWIDDGRIIYIHKNVPAPEPGASDSELPKYSPPNVIDYVLEVNAGFADKYKIKVGDRVEILDEKVTNG